MFEEIFEEELGCESVFRDASKLSSDYVPKVLVHREEEFRQLSRVFKSLIESRMSQRVLIMGSVGVGKTALARRFGEELEPKAKGRGLKLSYLHINCRKDKTPYAVLMKLVGHYNPRWPHRGLGPEKLLDMVVNHLNTHDEYLTLTLDELDYFIQLNGPDLLYLLTRAAEGSEGLNRLSLIAIAKGKGFLRSIDVATQSTFMYNVLTLNRYTAPQLVDILNQRIGEAFKGRTVDEETVSLIADIAARSGDARFALELLWRAGMIADGERSDLVTPEHARRAKADVYPEMKKEMLQDLHPHEKLLLLAVARKLKFSKRAYLLTGEAEQGYRVVCEEWGERPRGHTQLWGYLKRMDGLGLIELKPPGKENRGRSMHISVPDVPVAMLESEIERLLKSKR